MRRYNGQIAAAGQENEANTNSQVEEEAAHKGQDPNRDHSTETSIRSKAGRDVSSTHCTHDFV